MITIKSEREIAFMKQAGKIVYLTHQELKKHLKPGISTLELDEIAEKTIRKHGALPSFKNYNGFPASICTSINDEVVHGVPSGKKKLRNGDIVSIDIGACYEGYHGDSAWSYIVGKASAQDQRLLDITEKSLYVGLEQVKPGNRISDISHAIQSFVEGHGYSLPEELTGHGIGQNLHEDPHIPNFGSPNRGPIIKKGMTLAIEPMVNIGTKKIKTLSDYWTVVTMDRKRSAHFEHTIVVTDDGYEILTTM